MQPNDNFRTIFEKKRCFNKKSELSNLLNSFDDVSVDRIYFVVKFIDHRCPVHGPGIPALCLCDALADFESLNVAINVDGKGALFRPSLSNVCKLK
jgi:hypothetical protein